MIWKEGYTSIDKHRIYFQEWAPEKILHAQVLLIHGLGEHSGRWGHVGEFFSQSGLSITAMDLLGHGKSEGQRGHAESFDEYCKIIDFFLQDIGSRKPEIPVFLYGHSLGGLIALYYGIKRNPSTIKGIIATSPGLVPGFKVPQWKTIAGNMLYAITPRFSMDNGLPLDGLSQDKSVVEAYKKDPLNHPYISARLGMDLIRNGAALSQQAAELHLPLLIMVGSADRLISPQAVIDFAKNANHLTTLKVWEGGYHELHNEPFKLKVLAEITDWVKQIATNVL